MLTRRAIVICSVLIGLCIAAAVWRMTGDPGAVFRARPEQFTVSSADEVAPESNRIGSPPEKGQANSQEQIPDKKVSGRREGEAPAEPLPVAVASASSSAITDSEKSNVRESGPPGSAPRTSRLTPAARLKSAERAGGAARPDTSARSVADASSAQPVNAAPVAHRQVILNPSPPGPESWASFRNGNQQLGIAKTTLPAKPTLLWQFKTSDGMVGCAAIVGEQVYVPCINGELLSVDRKTGVRQWAYRSVDKVEPNNLAPAFKAAPTVDRDTIYIGDEEGTMHAVDRRTGQRKWKFSTKAEIAGAAALFKDKVIFGSHDFNLYCLSATTGKSGGWTFATENMVNCSTAIEGDNTFIAGCDTKIRVIDILKGREVSEVPLGESAYLIASPAVSGDMLYVGTHDGRVVGVNWRTKEIVWTYADPLHPREFRSSAAVTDDYVLLGCYDRKLYCLDRKKGTKVWAFTTHDRIESSPVVVGERVFFGSADGNVYGVNLKTGREAWRFRTGESVSASPAVGEKCLVIGSEATNGGVYCFGSK